MKVRIELDIIDCQASCPYSHNEYDEDIGEWRLFCVHGFHYKEISKGIKIPDWCPIKEGE